MFSKIRSIHIRPIGLVALLLLAGCAGPSSPPAPDSTSDDITPTTETPNQPGESDGGGGDSTAESEDEIGEDSQQGSDTSQPSESDTTGESDPRGPTEGSEWTVTITRVVDGDTVEARFPNGTVDTIRLIGVDTPETSYGDVSPGEYEGFPETTAARDHLFNWGEQASQYATDTLSGEEVRLVIDEEANRRGYFGRLLGYLYVDGDNFNKQLLTQGYARLYESSFSMEAAFKTAEQDARESDTGLWDFTSESSDGSSSSSGTDDSSAGVVVADIHADADGNDHQNLNDEYVVFENTGESTVDMGGWRVSDSVGHTYTIPSGFELESGGSVTLHTGSGSDADSDLYWSAGSAVWNNGGDTVTVKDETGTVVIKREY